MKLERDVEPPAHLRSTDWCPSPRSAPSTPEVGGDAYQQSPEHLLAQNTLLPEDPSDNESDTTDTCLKAYDLEDNESDLLPCQEPVYLQNILTTFQNTNSKDSLYRDEFEIALNSVTKVLQSRPTDLPYYSASLASVLLRLEDPFATSKFISKRQRVVCRIPKVLCL